MKIFIGYPPLNTNKGIPLLSQNRQFQYFKKPTYIYPVVPACAASLLKNKGFSVLWRDCIALGWSIDEFHNFIEREKPDLIAFETKTPVIKEYWHLINALKAKGAKGKAVLFGDHVSALPEESFQNSQVDYVLTGGDYDFLLLNLCDYISRAANLEAGIFYRENGKIKNTGKFQLNHGLDSLPFIDRDLTNWKLYAHQNGNYKRTPGTYIMSARDCWWGKCTFCSWAAALYPQYRTRSVNNVLNEIGKLSDKYGVKEIMDDSGSFPAGDWLKEFCEGMIKNEFNKRLNLNCNMRFGILKENEYRLMKKAGFRLLLFGLESANQETLNRIKKNLTVSQIIDSCKLARKCGLFPHITIMFGYPWETYNDAMQTLKLGRWLLKKGFAYTMQATVVIPYPGSRLFEECRNNDWLKTEDWQEYDMKKPVMLSGVGDENIMKFARSLYGVAFHPEFIYNRLLSVSGVDDMKFFLKAIPRVFGHILDFKHV